MSNPPSPETLAPPSAEPGDARIDALVIIAQARHAAGQLSRNTLDAILADRAALRAEETRDRSAVRNGKYTRPGAAE